MPVACPPPRYVNAPVELVYDQRISPGVALTFLRIYGMYWDEAHPPRLGLKDWQALTGLRKSAFYDHLNQLSSSGWLLFSKGDRGVLSFEFPRPASNRAENRPEKWTVANPLTESGTPKIESAFNASLQETGKASPLRGGSASQARQQRDPQLDHPAVKLYRAIMHLTANHTQRREIALLIGEAERDLEAWRQTLEHWSLHGWRPTNVRGMLDSHAKGGAHACQACQVCRPQSPQKPPRPSPESLEDLRQRFEEAKRQQERLQSAEVKQHDELT